MLRKKSGSEPEYRDYAGVVRRPETRSRALLGIVSDDADCSDREAVSDKDQVDPLAEQRHRIEKIRSLAACKAGSLYRRPGIGKAARDEEVVGVDRAAW